MHPFSYRPIHQTPAAIFLGLLFLTGLLELLFPLYQGTLPFFKPAGITLLVLSLGLALWAKVTFAKEKTSYIPGDTPTHLATKGPYRYTRNPMYLALISTFLGFCFLFLWAWGLIFVPLLGYLLQTQVIKDEEKTLKQTFGEDYFHYTHNTPRWL